MQLVGRGKRGRRPPRSANQEWVCGRLKYGAVCSGGPEPDGRCRSTYECTPQQTASGWICRRPVPFGGRCKRGPSPDGRCCKPISPCKPVRSMRAKRDVVAYAAAVVTVICLIGAFIAATGTQFLMPGPLSSAHGAIENCSACHTQSGDGKLSWIHGLIVGDPLGDSKACLSCHKMSKTAFAPHSMAPDLLRLSTERLKKVAARTPEPQAARVRHSLFPMTDIMSKGLFCATCHQEHQGIAFNLDKISNAQCQSCHIVQFDSFDGNHPKFSNYPFTRRTRITYDHWGHFGKHFPEIAEKRGPSAKIPNTCSSCHTSRNDRRHMAVVSFDQTCASCHLDQILGKERATGPKGIAFLTLPGVDMETLKSKNAPIGEWPEYSEAEVTPFMKVLIGRSRRGAALLQKIKDLDLLDLTEATDEQIAAVSQFTWEVKGLFYALLSGKASDVMARLNLGDGSDASPQLLAELTASIPRDVITSAQREWLPNLGAEVEQFKNAPNAPPPDQQTQAPPATEGEGTPSWTSSITESRLAGSVAPDELAQGGTGLPNGAGSNAGNEAVSGDRAVGGERLRVAQEGWRVDAFGRVIKGGSTSAPPEGVAPDDRGTASIDDGNSEAASDTATETDSAADAELADSDTADSADSADADPGAAAAAAPAPAPPIPTAVDAESWAEYGGWYRRDYAILYRPVSHQDRFIHAWLDLTAPRAPKGNPSPAAQVFNKLTNKDAQGQCTKCHSIDDVPGKGRKVNWAPSSVATQRGTFTRFVHEPHFGVLENRGCLICHKLEKGNKYLKSYEDGNPRSFVSNFSAVNKDLCQTCHTRNEARQDCLLCHKYHVNGVITPIMNTRIPKQ